MSALDPPPGPLARLAAWLAGKLLAGRPRELRRVLVVRPDDRVGNALLTIPLVRALQAALPGAQVDVLLAARRAVVADGLPGVRVVPFDKQQLFRSPLKFLRFLRGLRAYDAAIDASHWHSFSLTSALLARLASRGAVVGVARGAPSIYTRALALPAPEQPDVRSKLELLEGLDLKAPPEPPVLETSLGTGEAAAAWDVALTTMALQRGAYVALNPGGRKADHRWDPHGFGALAAATLRVTGLPSLVLWGPGEEELAAEVTRASHGAARPAPPTDLGQLAAAFRAAACVVTNDTGPMHLAVACGAPVVALQLSADAARWSHPGPRFEGLRVAPKADAASIEAACAAVRRFALTALAAPAERAPAARAATEEH